MENKQKREINKGGVNPVVAAVTGAIVGAGVVAGAVVLSDQKNRDKIKEVVTNAKEQATEKFQEVQKDTQEKIAEGKKDAQEKFTEGKKDAKEMANKAIDSLHKDVKAIVNGENTK